MAGSMSGSFSQNSSTGAYKFTLTWEITSQGIDGATPYSNVAFALKGERLNNSYNSYNNNSSYSFTIDSKSNASGNLNFDSRSWSVGTQYTLWAPSGTTRINHNSTGDKSIDLGFTLTTGTAGAGTVTVSGRAVLQDIAMSGVLTLSSSSLTISNSTGPTQSFTIGQYHSTYSYRVDWLIGSTTVATTSIPVGNTTVRSQVFGAAACGSAMANTKSATVTANLYTYSGSTQIGTVSTKTFTLNFAIAPTANTPTVTAKGNPSGISGYIKGRTYATVAISGASSPNGGSIKSYTFYQAGAAQSTVTTTSTSASWDSSVFNSTGSVTFMVRVTDSRGNYVDKSASAITVNDYAGPKITSYNAYRVSSGSTADPSGTSIYYTAAGSISASSQGNAITSFKVTIGSTSSTAATSSPISGTLSSFPISSAYTATFSLTDKMGNSTTATVPIPTASRIINVKSNKKGIAFGTFATTDNVIETPWQIKSSKAGVSGASAFLASHGTANMDVGMEVRRTDTNRMIELIIGSGGVNRGLYINDGNMAGWLLYYDDTTLHLTKPTQVENNLSVSSGSLSTLNGNVYAGQTSLDAEHYCEARSTGGRIEISSKSTGRGIWVDGGWVMFADKGSASPIWYGSLNGNASTASNLGFTGTVGASTNLNNITTLGKYYEPSSGSSYMPSNVPPGMTDAFVLYVVSANGSGNISGNWAYGQQILKTISGDRVYMRPMSTNGSGTLSFGDWTLIAGVTKSLWSGTLTNSALTISNGYLYNQYIIYGLPSGGSASTVVIPKSVVGTSDTQFELADNAGYRTFKIRHSGYDLIITGVGSYNGGVINSVHGAV